MTITPLSQKEPSKARVKNVLDFNQLCNLLSVDNTEKWCDWWDCNYIGTNYGDESEEDRFKREDEERDEAYKKYENAVVSVAEEVFERHGLSLVPVWAGKQPRRFIKHYRIQPKEGMTWKACADLVRGTIDGYGIFVFGNVRTFVNSGPYTYREAVLNHIGWIPDYYKVYGEGTAKSQVERRLRW